MKAYPWCCCTEQAPYLASEARGARLSGAAKAICLMHSECYTLSAQAHTHSESSSGSAAARNRGKLAWNIFILIKRFHFAVPPLLFLSYHPTDPATGPFNPITFLLEEVSIRHDLSKGQVGIPCWKGHFQCCSSWVGTRHARAYTELHLSHICQNRQT